LSTVSCVFLLILSQVASLLTVFIKTRNSWLCKYSFNGFKLSRWLKFVKSYHMPLTVFHLVSRHCVKCVSHASASGGLSPCFTSICLSVSHASASDGHSPCLLSVCGRVIHKYWVAPVELLYSSIVISSIWYCAIRALAFRPFTRVLLDVDWQQLDTVLFYKIFVTLLCFSTWCLCYWNLKRSLYYLCIACHMLFSQVRFVSWFFCVNNYLLFVATFNNLKGLRWLVARSRMWSHV